MAWTESIGQKKIHGVDRDPTKLATGFAEILCIEIISEIEEA